MARGEREEGWLQVGIPDSTPLEIARWIYRWVAHYKLIDPEFDPDEADEFGTVRMVSVFSSGVRELTPEDQLTGAELKDRRFFEEHFHDYEPIKE